MTRKELANRINTFETGNRKNEWPFVAIYLLGVAGIGLGICAWSRESELLAGIGVAVMFVWLIAPVFIVARINKKRMKALGLHCPSCNGGLTGLQGRLAVGTLHCTICGAKILEDDQKRNETQ